MSSQSEKNRREKVIHVDNLVIHAKNVEIIRENQTPTQPERRNPWDFFWRGQQRNQDNGDAATENIPGEELE